MATTLEHDFTIEGKKGHLQCPFSKSAATDGNVPEVEHQEGIPDGTPHKSADPICAAMYEETASQMAAAAVAAAAANAAASSKCPIRYMDQHSPEEIAHYVETHKHELPRSHEVCLRRYQRNEDEIRKLDSKYGDLVSMIEGLSHIHQPMLPESQQPHQRSEVDKASNERVESWAKDVSATTDPEEKEEPALEVEDRESHFDRPLKEVRVGESPSRPWGISVPVYEPFSHDDHQPMSPPPAPVRMTSPVRRAHTPPKPSGGKCPFDHTKLSAFPSLDPPVKHEASQSPRAQPMPRESPFEQAHEQSPTTPVQQPQPAFVNPDLTKGGSGAPQMIFTGPVFIGYPMEQAIQFMNQYRGNQ